MNIKLIELNLAIMNTFERFSDKHNKAIVSIVKELTPTHRETLKQLVEQGPVEDGDIVSKSARDDLITWDLAVRACIKNRQGYTVANYKGWAVHKGPSKK